jgi:acetoin utilization deacetylase AcuC-like enzyme
MITVFSEEHLKRNAKTELYGGRLVAPHECPERAQIVLERVRAVGLGEVVAPAQFGLGPALKVHDERFVEFLQSAWRDWVAAGNLGEAIPDCWPARRMTQRCPSGIAGRLGYYAMAAETSISAGTWEAAQAAADVAITAAGHLQRGARGAFALCRPPGHHAARDLYGGYCFLNNAAIAAQSLRDHGAARVAVLDVDFHHGNGTQDIFYDRADVLYVSLHGDPAQASALRARRARRVVGSRHLRAGSDQFLQARLGRFLGLRAHDRRMQAPDALRVRGRLRRRRCRRERGERAQRIRGHLSSRAGTWGAHERPRVAWPP